MSGSATTRNKDFGQMLVEENLISDEQLQAVKALSQQNNCRIEHTLVEEGLFTPEQGAMLVGFHLNIPFISLKIINLTRQQIDPEALELIPESMAREYGVIPLEIADGAILVVMEDPEDVQAIIDMASSSGRRIEPAVGIPSDIREAIDWNYRTGCWLN